MKEFDGIGGSGGEVDGWVDEFSTTLGIIVSDVINLLELVPVETTVPDYSRATVAVADALEGSDVLATLKDLKPLT